MKQLVSRGGGGNPFLLQEGKNVAEQTNDDYDVNTEANKVDFMVVKMK